MKKKSLLLGVLSLALTATTVFAIGSCDESEQPHTHTWGELQVTKTPTCTEKGEGFYACADCEEILTETIDEVGHQFVGGECACGEREQTTDKEEDGENNNNGNEEDGENNNNNNNNNNDNEEDGENNNNDSEEDGEDNEEVASEGLNYTLLDNNTYEVSGIGTCKDKNLIIPASYNEKAVTSIGQAAFSDCNSLTSVVIPDSITSIGAKAFSSCWDLKSVVIPNSVTVICDGAFVWCDSLTSIEIPDSVIAIGAYAFFECGNLTSVEIGNSVVTIYEEAFFGCYKLVEVVNKSQHLTITKGDDSNGCVGSYALGVYNSGDEFVGSKLSNDDGYIVYTDSGERVLVGYIGQKTDLVLPTYITRINQSAFRYCSHLTSVVIGDSVTKIDAATFYYCSSLTKVVIGNSVTTISSYAFENCDKLTSIEIPDAVTMIEDYAFENCGSLKSIIIGKNLTLIADYAFRYCSSLTSVYYKSTAEEWAEISVGEYNEPLTNATIYYFSETNIAGCWHYNENDEIVLW